MKLGNILAALVVGGAALFGPAAVSAQAVTSVADLANDKCYSINRLGSTGGYVFAQGDQVVFKSGTNRTDEARWTFYYSEELGMRYLYNIGTGKFLTASNGVAVLTDVPAPVNVDYVEKGTTKGMIVVLEESSDVIGMRRELAGTNVAVLSDSIVANDGFFLRVQFGRDLTAEEVAAMNAKVDPQAVRAQTLAGYREFVNKVKEMDKDGYSHYAGGYDITALAEALDNDANYSVADFRVLYNQALESRAPKAGHYYRIKNTTRPTAKVHTNVAGLKDDFSGLQVRAVANVRPGSSGTVAENLSLFLFDGSANDGVQLRAAANGRCVGDSNSGRAVALTEVGEGNPYFIEFVGDWSREIRFQNSQRATWLTTSPDGGVHNYGILEDPMNWWVEEITEITINVPANCYTGVTLPCAVELPEGMEAYIVTKATNEKVVINSIGTVVPAHTPVILKSAEKGTFQVAVLPEYVNVTPVNQNLLKGNTVGLKNMPVRYAVSTLTAEQGMKRNTATSIAANSVYLDAESLGLTESSIPFEIGASGVENVTVGPERPDLLPGDMIYDYSGRRVRNPLPGLYLNGTTGRPVMIR